MKSIISIFVFFFICQFLPAQNTATLAGVVVSDHTVYWANATWSSKTIIPGGGGTAVYHDGTPVPSVTTGQLSSIGAATGSLPRTSMIYPTGVTQRITICSNTSAPCVTLSPATISGTTFDLGAFATAWFGAQNPVYTLASAIIPSSMTYSYGCSIISNPVMGDGCTDTLTSSIYYFGGVSWIPAVAGGAPSGPAGGDLTGTYPNPTVNTTTVPKLASNNSFTGSNTFPGVQFLTGGTQITNLNFGVSGAGGSISANNWIVKSPLSIQSTITNSTGFQTASATLCAAAANATCVMTVPLPVTMPSSNYNITGCTINGAAAGTPIVGTTANQTTTNFAALIYNASASPSTAVGILRCIVSM